MEFAVPVALAARGGMDQLVALADRGEGTKRGRFVAAVELEVQGAIGPGRRVALAVAGQQAEQAAAVEVQSGGRFDASCVEQRRRNVDVGRDPVDGVTAGRQARRPARQQRRPDASLEHGSLAAAEPGVVAVAVRSVVDQEDDERVLGETQFVQPRHQSADVVVDVADHRVAACQPVEDLLAGLVGIGKRRAQVCLPVVLQPVLRNVVERAVGRVRRHVGEERPALPGGLLHELERGVEVDVRAVAGRLLAVSVAKQHRVRVPALAAGRVGGLADAAAAVNQALLEALVHRAHRVGVAQVPLAEDAGGVAGVPELLGDGDLLRLHHRPADVGVDGAGAVVVAARHQRGARRRADRADVEALDLSALRRQGVEVRRPEDRVAGEAEVAVALVVGHDEHDVGWLGSFGRFVGRSAAVATQRPDGEQNSDELCATLHRFPST